MIEFLCGEKDKKTDLTTARNNETTRQDHRMSLDESGSPEIFKRVPISFMFLSNFEMKRGNETVWSCKWSETNCDIDLENIEFKSLPSGVHGVPDDVINFAVPKRARDDEYYYGVAFYKQNGQDIAQKSGQVDRNQVKMYALGVIIDPKFSARGIPDDLVSSWWPTQFIGANAYVDDLQQLLTHWLAEENFENYDLFEEYFKSNSLIDDGNGTAMPLRSAKLAQEFLSPDVPRRLEDAGRPQMLEYLPYWIRKLGPLIFPVWKSCLLGERILIINPPGGSFEACNALTYCLSLLSAVPNALQVSRHEDRFIRPLFTIGISDIDRMASNVAKALEREEKLAGFVACTSDEILTCKTELYDKVLRIPSGPTEQDDDDVCALFTSSGIPIKATPHDLECLQAFYQSYLGEQMSEAEKVRLSQTVEPVSWTQYLIDEFYWWTTAGYVAPFYHEHRHPEKTIPDDEAEMVLEIVGYFHEKTTGIYNRLKAIIESNELQGPDELISVPFSALSEMDLDFFSAQDQELVKALAWKWFEREVRITVDYCEAVC